jgi:hypothetical protein
MVALSFDGTVSGSVVRDPDVVILPLSAGPTNRTSVQDLWTGEFSSDRPADLSGRPGHLRATHRLSRVPQYTTILALYFTQYHSRQHYRICQTNITNPPPWRRASGRFSLGGFDRYVECEHRSRSGVEQRGIALTPSPGTTS